MNFAIADLVRPPVSHPAVASLDQVDRLADAVL
jgi:hypothetical protein